MINHRVKCQYNDPKPQRLAEEPFMFQSEVPLSCKPPRPPPALLFLPSLFCLLALINQLMFELINLWGDPLGVASSVEGSAKRR